MSHRLSVYCRIPKMDIQTILQNQILKAAEEQLDAEITKLDELTEDDFEEIRKRRIQEMKLKQKQLQDWKANVRYLVNNHNYFNNR